MAELTGIQWCHHSFNPWWGCVEVSPGCDHCYARQDARRYGHLVWGRDAGRRFFGDGHWSEPLRWDRNAGAAGERRRVFCASMADVGEERDDAVGRQMDEARQRLWRVIAGSPRLDWLLLTKRPAGLRRLLPPEIASLPNVWPGVTVERADYTWRIDELLELPCAGRRWISYEPALGPVDFERWLSRPLGTPPALAWVLVGGESGPGARPFAVTWARDVLAQCRAAGVSCFVKQLGTRPFDSDPTESGRSLPVKLRDRRGGDPAEWPADLRVREYPRRLAGG